MPTRHKRLYGYQWQQLSKAYLQMHPLCVQCSQPATLVDHVQPHDGDLDLFWDEANWQPMCWSCHGRKSSLERRACSGPGPPPRANSAQGYAGLPGQTRRNS